jgi:prepilin-type N-terminal cleavage/methylation domain-containing protein
VGAEDRAARDADYCVARVKPEALQTCVVNVPLGIVTVDRRGFTLIEVLVVIAVIAVQASEVIMRRVPKGRFELLVIMATLACGHTRGDASQGQVSHRRSTDWDPQPVPQLGGLYFGVGASDWAWLVYLQADSLAGRAYDPGGLVQPCDIKAAPDGKVSFRWRPSEGRRRVFKERSDRMAPSSEPLGPFVRYQRDTGFTVAPADVEVITQVKVHGRDGRSPTERFWHIVRKFADD